jgi:hypothetical protein
LLDARPRVIVKGPKLSGEDEMAARRDPLDDGAHIAIVGGGPAGVVAAIALARRGIPTTVLERGAHPEQAPRFDPDRSYTIDITGHGLRALRHIDATTYFDKQLLPFRGLRYQDRVIEDWPEPGWTGSRGDIMRALMSVVDDRHENQVHIEFGTSVTAVDIATGSLTCSATGAEATSRRFDLIIGADGAGSVVRTAMEHQVPGFSLQRKSLPNYLTMIELDRLSDQLDETYLHALATRPFCIAGAIKGDEQSASPRWFCAIGTKTSLTFTSPSDARRYLRRRCPRVLDLASSRAIEDFAGRTCYHIGQKLTCSRLHARCRRLATANLHSGGHESSRRRESGENSPYGGEDSRAVLSAHEQRHGKACIDRDRDEDGRGGEPPALPCGPECGQPQQQFHASDGVEQSVQQSCAGLLAVG